jgi:hypothetical protein
MQNIHKRISLLGASASVQRPYSVDGLESNVSRLHEEHTAARMEF